MDALILGGNSAHNREWVQQVKTALTPLFTRIETHEYAHWARAESNIDFEHELPSVVREARDLTDDYVVIAKSAGVLLCLRGIAENTIRPEKVVFLGTPLNFVKQHSLEYEFEAWLGKVNEQVLVIQNAHDPVVSARELERYLKEQLSPALLTFVELPGDTHDYVDFPKLYELIASFVAGPQTASR